MNATRFLRILPAAALLLAGLGCSSPSADGTTTPDGDAAAAPAGTSPVVAHVGDRSITLDEVDERARSTDMQLYQSLYDSRERALEAMIAEQLLQDEADSRGVTVEQLLETEVASKVPEITDADVKSFYDQNQQQIGNRPLAQVSSQIRAYLTARDHQKVQTALLDSIKNTTPVSKDLEPPRADVVAAADQPSLGPQDAPVQIVEFSDFQCPYCGRVAPTVKQLHDIYGDDIRVSFLDLPLPMHPQAPIAAAAGQCALAQGKFWEFHDKMFSNQKALSADDLKGYAKQLGLDTAKFDACLDANTFKSNIDDDARIAHELGISGTPAFFINGRFINGAQPMEKFREVIDEELRGAGVEPPA